MSLHLSSVISRAMVASAIDIFENFTHNASKMMYFHVTDRHIISLPYVAAQHHTLPPSQVNLSLASLLSGAGMKHCDTKAHDVYIPLYNFRYFMPHRFFANSSSIL